MLKFFETIASQKLILSVVLTAWSYTRKSGVVKYICTCMYVCQMSTLTNTWHVHKYVRCRWIHLHVHVHVHDIVHACQMSLNACTCRYMYMLGVVNWLIAHVRPLFLDTCTCTCMSGIIEWNWNGAMNVVLLLKVALFSPTIYQQHTWTCTRTCMYVVATSQFKDKVDVTWLKELWC